jgi:hypothetical protein
MKIKTSHLNLDEKRRLIEEILDALVEAVAVGSTGGAPGSVLYTVMQEKLGIDLPQFEAIMRALVMAGRLEKQGDLYFLGKKANYRN